MSQSYYVESMSDPTVPNRAELVPQNATHAKMIHSGNSFCILGMKTRLLLLGITLDIDTLSNIYKT